MAAAQQERLPVWLAVGGTPASASRAGALGLPMYLAILGSPPRFRALAELHRTAAAEAGHEQPRLGVTSHFHVAETSQAARDEFFPHYAAYFAENMPRAGRIAREVRETWAAPDGALFAGTPAEIVDKILWEYEMLGHTRFLAQVGLGGVGQRETLRSIELLATEVLPEVRAALAG